MTTPAQPRTPDRDSPAFAGPYAPGQPMPSDEQITAYLEMESYMARAMAHTTDGSSIEERTAIAARFVRAAVAEPGGNHPESPDTSAVQSVVRAACVFRDAFSKSSLFQISPQGRDIINAVDALRASRVPAQPEGDATLRTLAGKLCETFGKAMDAHRLHRHLGFMCQCGPCGASYAAHARLSAHLGEKATSQCCPRDHDHDGNCDRHPAPRVGVDPSVPNPAIVVPPQPEAATGERPPPTVETAEGWRSKCKVHTAKDGTRYVKEPGGLLLQVGSRQWEGTNADAYFPSERAARAALAKAPPPPGVEPAPAVTLPLADAQGLLRAIDAWGLVLKPAIVLREAIERATP